jgi:hypothetical protein
MFECEHCVYKTPHRSSFNAHLKSKKHAKIVEIKQENGGNRMSLCDFYKCKRCNKPYFSYSGLWGHNKQCGWKTIQVMQQIQTTNTPQHTTTHTHKEMQNTTQHTTTHTHKEMQNTIQHTTTHTHKEMQNTTQHTTTHTCQEMQNTPQILPPPPPPPPKETEHSRIQELYMTNDTANFNSLNPLLQIQTQKTPIEIQTQKTPTSTPPTHLQINSIIKGFFNNTHNKRIDTEICKEKAKEIDKRVKNIHTELQTMIESVYNHTKNKSTHTPIHNNTNTPVHTPIHIPIHPPLLVQ